MGDPKVYPENTATVGELRAALEGLPAERIIVPQVVGTVDGAWNMFASFLPVAPHGNVAVLTLWHPNLARLPLIANGGGPPREATPGTVRVRIAVAVDEHGRWRAWGTVGAHDDTAKAEALSFAHRLHSVATLHWVEANVSLPLAPQTVQGIVTETTS